MTPVDGAHPYLLIERLIPASVLADLRFAGRIRIDVRGNAVFPHIDRDGVCGYEIKNRNFTGFAPGGEKGLWCSRTEDDDLDIVICETAIDALSHFAIRHPPRTRYISTGGTLNATQPDLILAAIRKMPDEGKIINAVDNDDGGDRLTILLNDILARIPGPRARSPMTGHLTEGWTGMTSCAHPARSKSIDLENCGVVFLLPRLLSFFPVPTPGFTVARFLRFHRILLRRRLPARPRIRKRRECFPGLEA